MKTPFFKFGRHLAIITSIYLACFTSQAGFARDMSLAGIWMPDNSRSQRLPSPLPLTTEGAKALSDWQAGRDSLEDDPGRFCQSPGIPSLALSGAGYPVEIVITEDTVYMLMEIHQQVRRVFLDAEHPARALPQRNGHSIGHWEGDTLVVDTTLIRPIYFGAVPHSEQVHVVERFHVMDDGNTLIDEVTITDPALYSEPIVINRYFTAEPDDALMYEYECTESLWIEHMQDRGFEPFSP